MFTRRSLSWNTSISGLANTVEFDDDDEFDVFACSFRKRMYLVY